ncbi:MAG TPA: LysM peptidoglycan-binding domain-containing protein [Accumulibacter sp.]|uniref:LysM peptidoglycan-binding domain-containing protein n=1 Tax=Accumulibacter sp. TaxID=2053492 RepID=UPI002B6099EA|nr:LysM peptidoglycan-binding domain-containing protein [Accumulibacter sp.]HRF74687.1 LysM peptidoglycan-binding domain-containing protein [Accumulibacter sp.]
MTPRIAYAIALSLACSTAWSDEVASQVPPANLSLLQKNGSPSAAAVPVGADGPLPVIEVAAPAQLPETIDLTSDSEELFQHLRRGFSMPNINNELVLHHQQWYSNRPDYLRRMVERSSRYLHFIVGELEKRGMPMELALLPMVESAYNPTAYSRSHASGLWQFVPATGKQYKLEQNWWVDERRDTVASTGAALDYLQYIYELHGDWHLALASYNWGEGAVGRAINKNKAQGLPTDYLSLKMPEETRNYVPKLQALKNIFSNPNILASLGIHGVPNRPYFATVTKPTNIDVKLAAQLAEMPVQEFVALNPSHNRPVIKSETPMVIPADKVATFKHNLETHEESDKPLSSWQAYTLRPGEKLEQVAPRFGMTLASLKAANGIQGRGRVASGVTLLVAGQDGADPEDVANAATSTEQPVVSAPTRLPQVVDQAPVAAAAARTRTQTHTVRKGETLLAVAQRYDMSLAELRQINKLRSDRVQHGSKLTVAAPEKASVPAPAAAPRTVVAERDGKPAPAASTRTHTVRKGETLFSIADHYDMSVAEIKQLNKLRSDRVTAGSTLAVAAPEPAKVSSARSRSDAADVDRKPDLRANVARVSFVVPAPRSAEALAKHAEAGTKKATRLAQYTIRRGDTLVSIARQFKVDKDDLLRWNRIPATGIKPGLVLTIQQVQQGATL